MSGSLFGNFVMKNKFCSLFFYSSILYVFMDLSYIPIYFPTGAKSIEDLFLDHIIIPIVSKINQYMSSKKFPIYLKSLNVWNFILNNFYGLMFLFTLLPINLWICLTLSKFLILYLEHVCGDQYLCVN